MYTLLVAPAIRVDPKANLPPALIERLPSTRIEELDTLLPATWAAASRTAHRDQVKSKAA
jgi:hypothetical protein